MMKKSTTAFLILLFFLSSFSVFAQKKSSGSSDKNFGVGLRLGDPLGISLKKYMGNKAIEFSLGRTHLYYGGRYYNNRFDKWYKNKNYGYREFQYLSYASSTPIGFQLHYLVHKDLGSINNLQWYAGAGVQFRYQKYYFDYRYKVQGDPSWYYAVGENVTDIDLGLDGVLGLEYTFSGIPLSVFGDINLFMELADNPFAFWLQGGIGVRYNF